jgi:dihydrodipicolinate reductase
LVRLAIAGGGIGGSALISLLRGDSYTHLVGVYENKHDAPGVVLARKWNIPVFADLESFATVNPDVVVNVTGDSEISNKIRSVFKNKVEVIEGVGRNMKYRKAEAGQDRGSDHGEEDALWSDTLCSSST